MIILGCTTLYDAVSGHVESLSGSVIKNLTLHRVNKISSFYHNKKEIRSFPTMYNTLWGVHRVFIGSTWGNKLFFPKNWSKNTNFRRQRSWMIQLRSGLGYTIFKVTLFFTCVLKTIVHQLRNELWRSVSMSAGSSPKVGWKWKWSNGVGKSEMNII